MDLVSDLAGIGTLALDLFSRPVSRQSEAGFYRQVSLMMSPKCRPEFVLPNDIGIGEIQ
jgi:hypothetical protein